VGDQRTKIYLTEKWVRHDGGKKVKIILIFSSARLAPIARAKVIAYTNGHSRFLSNSAFFVTPESGWKW
jgi:hypothetical protein